jgi:hypothetical protein
VSNVIAIQASVREICEGLRKEGVVRVPNFIDSEDVTSLLEEAKIAVTSANYRHAYGDCCRYSLDEISRHLSLSRELISGRHLDKLPVSFKSSRAILGSHLFQRVIREYLGPQAGFMEVIAFTKDYIPDSHAVYGKLHYDRRHQLKVIVYLNDVDEYNGAFSCIPGSHVLGERLFVDAWRKVLGLADDAQADEIKYQAARVPEDLPVYRTLPCVFDNHSLIGDFLPDRDCVSLSGQAGTLVIFDTHLLHRGGFVQRVGQERWTLKGHTFAETLVLPHGRRFSSVPASADLIQPQLTTQ